jgi:hypothetical protein
MKVNATKKLSNEGREHGWPFSIQMDETTQKEMDAQFPHPA